MDDRDKLDRFLDEALAEYSDANPRTGFEQRLLANLPSVQDERGWSWRWLWLVGPALAAMVLIAVLALRPTPKHEENRANKTTVMESAAPPRISSQPIAPERPAVARIQPKRRTHRKVAANTRPSPEPRLATFPAPDGDDQQARLLLSFVTRHPDTAKEVVREEQEFQEMAEASMNQDSKNRSERQQ
jgi:hypothetical protein